MTRPCLLTLVTLLGACTLVFAKDNKKASPKTWKEKAAARFGDTPHPDQKAKIDAALPTASVKPKKAHRILVFWRCEGYIHTSIPFGNYALEKTAAKTGAFSMDLADDYSVFTPENLAKYDAILFNNTTRLAPDKVQQKAILDFVNGGKGIIGFHAAADNFGEWPDGIAMMGGIFRGHPWTAGGRWAFKLDDPKHRLNKAFKGKGFWHTDEIYWYNPDNFQGRERLRVLLSLDMSKATNIKPLENKKNQALVTGANKDVDVPVSWVKKIGKGRLFFTNLGHRDDTFWDPTDLQHMLDGIQFALGDLEADTTPSAKVHKQPALAPAE